MRDAPRLHVDTPLVAGETVPLAEDRAHYLLHVMRAAPGDPVRVFNATDGEWTARIADGARRRASLVVEAQTRPPAAGSAGPTLIFAPLKRDATDLVVRMATELGARAIVPVVTQRTLAARVNTARLALIAREAAEQCERLDLPAIAEPRPLAAVLAAWDPAVVIALAVERAAPPAAGAQTEAFAAAGAVLIGPEGGWARAELDQLLRAPFVQPVSLGALVLRADTAAVAALAALAAAHGWGDPVGVAPGAFPGGVGKG